MSASGHIDRLIDVRQYEFVFTVVANLIVCRVRSCLYTAWCRSGTAKT